MQSRSSLLTRDPAIRRAVLILLYMGVAAGALWFLKISQPLIRTLLNVLSPFIVALIVAYIFNPLVNLFQRRFRLGRLAGVALAYLIIIAAVTGGLWLLLPVLYGQVHAGLTAISSFVTSLPELVQKLASRYQIELTPEQVAQARAALEGNLDLQQITQKAGPAVQELYKQIAAAAGWVTGAAVWGLSFTLGIAAFFSFVLMITFYFLLDYARLGDVVRTILPLERERRVFEVWDKVDRALSGLLRGQLIVCCLISVLYAAGLFALGMRQYALLVGLLAGFGNLIPYFGPILGGVPTALWVIFSGEFDPGREMLIGLGCVLLLSVTIQSMDGFLFQPRIVGKSAELHPVVVILALLVGAQFGIGGMIVAVPVTVVVRVLLKEFWWDRLVAEEAAEKSAEQDAASSPPAP